MKDELIARVEQIKEEPVTMWDAVAGQSQLSPSGLMAIDGSFVSHVAEKERMIMNPNKEVLLKIIDRIYKCDGYCPCQPKDTSIDTRCPCPDFVNNGVCHCRLFVPAE